MRWFLFFIILLSSLTAYSQTLKLEVNGLSHVYFPIKDSKNKWYVYESYPSSKRSESHYGSDTYADDWNLLVGYTSGIITDTSNCNRDKGAEVIASFAGEVIHADINNSIGVYGKEVIIQSSQNDSFAMRYSHLDTVTVNEGDIVNVGEKLGSVGNTGAKCAHLHHVLYKELNPEAIKRLKEGRSPNKLTGSADIFAANFVSDATDGENVNNLTPYLSSLSKTYLYSSASLHKLSLYGQNFQPHSRVQWKNSEDSDWKELRRNAKYFSESQLKFEFNDGGIDSTETWYFRIVNGTEVSDALSINIYPLYQQISETCNLSDLSYDVNTIIPFKESGFSDISITDINEFLRNQGSALYNLDLGNYNLDPPITSLQNKTFSQYEDNWNLSELNNNLPTTQSYSPAKIIYLAAKENGMSPILMLAFIQKEQSLISQKYSGYTLQNKLNRAVGYGMFDGGDDGQYYSFLAQLAGLSFQYNKDIVGKGFYRFLTEYATKSIDEENLFNTYNQYRNYFIKLGYNPCGQANSLIQIDSISPNNTKLDQKTTFTIKGQKLPNTLAFWVADCKEIVRLSSSSTQTQFQCIPSYTTGNKRGIIKDRENGSILKEFDIDFLQSLKLDNELKITNDVFDYIENILSSYFSPTQPTQINTLGQYYRSYSNSGYLKNVNGYLHYNYGDGQGNYVYGSATIHDLYKEWGLNQKDEINIGITSVYPSSATLNQLTTFTVKGENLPNTLAFWIDDCANLTKTASSSTQVTFSCTPSYSIGNKSGVVKDKAGGSVLKNFSTQVSSEVISSSIQFINKWKTTSSLNVGGNNAWVIRNVSGSNAVNICESISSNKCLNIENGYLQNSTIQSNWWSAQWFLESVNNEYVRINNRWKSDQYIHFENSQPTTGQIQSGWWSAQWKVNN
jgi:hypothetical protein